MSSITAVKTENDGRQWYAVTFIEDGEESRTDEFGVTKEGVLLDSDGCPVDYNDYIRNSVLRAIDAIKEST